ncbi:MAG: hypothetical protein LUD81_06275 [Clostridiales bacterium]|nr:hypothetical protein [Clostridiales bacterium]
MTKKEKTSAFLLNAEKYKLKHCLLNLINDVTLDESEGLPDDVVRLKKEVFDCVSELSGLLKTPDSEREPFYDKLAELKVKVLEAAVPVYALSNYGMLAESLIHREEISRSSLEQIDKTFPPEEVIEVLNDFIDDEITENKEDVFFSDLISMVPCIMSRGKFAEYVEKALDCDDAADIYYENIITNMPFTVSEGRETFPEMYDKLDTIFRSNINKISKEELEGLSALTPPNNMDIFTYTDCVSMLYNDINYITALALYCYDIDFVTDGDMILKDIFYSAAELCAKESLDEIDIELRRQTNDKSEEILEASEDYFEKQDEENKFIEKLYKTKEADDTDIQHMLLTLSRTNNLYSAELESFLSRYKSGKNPKGLDSPKAAANAFISDFENGTASFSAAVKKSLRREIIQSLPCPYSRREVLGYIKNVLDRYYNKPEYAIVFDGVTMAMNFHDSNFMNKMIDNLKNFNFSDDGCGCEDHHHNHDDHCDCGCDHHHDHSHNFEKHL